MKLVCEGTRVDQTCGEVYCPRGVELDDDENWDDVCARCQGEFQSFAESMESEREVSDDTQESN